MDRDLLYFFCTGVLWAQGFMGTANIRAASPAATSAPALPEQWIDATTGRRVVRLSRLPGSSIKFYFHQNGFTADGRMVFKNITPNGQRRLVLLNLKTLAQRPVVEGVTQAEIVSRRTKRVYYRVGREVRYTDLDTGKTHTITTLPEAWTHGSGFAVNADDTLLAGSFTERMAEFREGKPRGYWFGAIHAAHLPSALYTINIRTGARKIIHRENNWVNHVQFSPTDPQQLMFCHEGPWHLVHRIWLIRTDGEHLRKIHERAVKLEIAGHEFWAPDGQRVWFDLQIPKGETFFLAGSDIVTGKEIRYPLTRDQWSLHFDISDDGRFFVGDGGSPRQVARAKDGKWIWLFAPEGEKLRAERLCSLAEHDYDLEPNVNITPDNRWVVFRSNMHGPAQVYAVALP